MRHAAMAVTAEVSDSAITVRDKLCGRIGQARAKRYWPGKAPEWAADPEDDRPDLPCTATPLDKAFPRPTDRADAVAGGDVRRIRQAEVVSTAEEKGDRVEPEVAPASDEEEAQEERRRRIRERRLLRQRGEGGALAARGGGDRSRG